MSPDPLTVLLGDEPPATVLALPDEARERLVALVATARERQQRLADESVTTALRSVPLPVRGVVRKALLG